MTEGRVDKTIKKEAQRQEAMLRKKPMTGSWSLTERKEATADVAGSGLWPFLPPALCGPWPWPFAQSLVFPALQEGL